MTLTNNDDLSSEENKYLNLSEDFFQKYISKGITIGLGSGRTVENVVRNFDRLEYKNTLEFIVTSLQIKLVTESAGLKVVAPSENTNIDVVLDGADQIDSNFNMIKGGGGALMNEKILIHSSKKVVIVAQDYKFVDKLNMAVPIEVSQFGRTFVMNKLKKIGGLPQIRLLNRGYPYITENGNIIYDTLLPTYHNLKEIEREVKNIPGVIEVGLFTNPANSYYKIKNEFEFKHLSPKR